MENSPKLNSLTYRFTQSAANDYQFFVKNDKKLAKKINQLILNILETPYDGIGKPEQLRHELTGHWSRRISAEHRLVYRVIENEVQIISCRFHYK